MNKFEDDTMDESEKCFRAVLENPLVGLAITSPEGKLVMTNPALQNMLGYTHDELHTGYIHITHPDDKVKNLNRRFYSAML